MQSLCSLFHWLWFCGWEVCNRIFAFESLFYHLTYSRHKSDIYKNLIFSFSSQLSRCNLSSDGFFFSFYFFSTIWKTLSFSLRSSKWLSDLQVFNFCLNKPLGCFCEGHLAESQMLHPSYYPATISSHTARYYIAKTNPGFLFSSVSRGLHFVLNPHSL